MFFRSAAAPPGTPGEGSIWPHVERQVVDLVTAHRSTIVFVNSRRLAERLTARLNEIYAEDTEPGSLPPAPARPPAQIMVPSEVSRGAPAELAMAHHGSVSKERRALIEDALKSGRLRAVVATSSLELGIDMGAVDLVVQVESPPSVASGLQRVGRAGHQVGEVSRAVVFPKHRADLVHSAVTVERMLEGAIEALAVISNPLDVLAQQTVAACALESIDVEDWFAAVRRTAPYVGLPRSAFEATLDMLAGKYPSADFAELRPRLCGAATPGPSQADRARSGSPSPPAAPSRTAGCSGCSWWARRPPGSGNWTRRWSTSRGSVTCSRSGRRAGAWRRSRTTGSWSPPPPAGRDGCRSGSATTRAGPPSWGAPSRQCSRRTRSDAPRS